MKNTALLTTTFIMAVLSILAFYFAWNKGRHVEGMILTKNLLFQTVPILIFAFILAGMIQVLIPPNLIAKWLGNESGFRGLVIGSIAGGLLPGGPYVTLPVVAGLMKLGISAPVMVSMLTGWSLIAVSRLPMEIGIIGPKLAFLRLASVFIFAPIAGLFAKMIIKIFNIS